LLSLRGTFFYIPGHTLVKLFQLRRQISPVRGVKILSLFLERSLLSPLKIYFPHGKSKLMPAQNLIKV
jgi:hypothetical protein